MKLSDLTLGLIRNTYTVEHEEALVELTEMILSLLEGGVE